MKKTLSSFKEYVLPFVLALLPVFSVFFPSRLTGPFLGLVILVFLFEESKLENFRRNKKYLIPYLFFLLFCAIAALVSKDIALALKTLERYISLLVIPIIIFCSNLNQRRIRFLLQFYVVLLLIVSAISVGRLIWFVNTFADWIEVMRGVNKNDTYVQFKYPHLMWDVHPSYWSYLMVIGNVILLNNNYFKKPFSKVVSIIILILLNINLLYLAARLPVLVNIIIHLVTFITIFFKQRRLLLLLFTGSVVLIFIAYFQFPFFRYKIEAIATDDRFFLWTVSFEEIKNNYFVLGEGLGQAKPFIEDYLGSIVDPRVDYKGNEIHNQYLTVLLETGLLGLLALLFVYINSGIVGSIRRGIKTSLPLISILILVILASMIEPFFNVIKGIVLFSLFSAIFKLQKSMDLNKENGLD